MGATVQGPMKKQDGDCSGRWERDSERVFNMISSLSQKKQSVKINQGLEVFREFYPKNEEFIILECVWNSDKFELIERTHKSEIASPDGDISLGTSVVLYQSIESFLGDDESIPQTEGADHTAGDCPVQVKEDKIDLLSGLSNYGDDGKLVECCEDGSNIGEPPGNTFSQDCCFHIQF